MTIIRR